jgi:hypothetical protein
LKPSRLRPDQIEREHLYRQDGVIVARHLVLKQRRAGKKVVLWERADGAGCWLTGLGGLKVGLYRYDEFRALPADQRRRCPILEGEKDVDASWAAGVPAVCGPSGASTWTAAYAQLIADAGVREVPAVGDHDDAGSRYNARIVLTCTALGLRASAVPWEVDRPPGFDVADFLAESGADGPRRWRERLDTTACAAPSPGAGHAEAPKADGFDLADLIARCKTNKGAPFQPAVVKALAALPREEYESWRAQLKKAGVRVPELDKATKEAKAAQADARLKQEAVERQAAARAQEAQRAAMAAERAATPEPPVDLAALLHEIMAWVRRYVVLTVEQAVAVVLWVAHTHALDAADCTPYLQIGSATKRAGKTRLLEVLETLVARAWFTGRTTAAALVRRIDQDKSTLLLDESDAAFKGEKEYSEALRGTLNSGYRRSGKSTVCVGHGTEIEVRDFSTFSAKAIAGIGKLPDTVADRSIPIALRRKTTDEPCERWRERVGHAQAAPLKARLSAWAHGAVPDLREARPELSTAIGDRLQDVWEPLVAIADTAGGEWPERARRAAVVLAGGVEDTDVTVELLSDIAAILDLHEGPFIATAALIEKLVAFDERPWGTWRHDKPITPKGLAGLLKPLLIHSTTAPDGKLRGYRITVFHDAIARYLTLHPSKRQNTNEERPETSIQTRQDGEAIDTSKTAETPIDTVQFDGLTLRSPGERLVAKVGEQSELFPPAPVSDRHLEPVPAVGATSAHVPFMITRATEAELRQQGYTRMDEHAAIQAEDEDVAKF